ncbi:MAG: PaaI family thioesterase [Gordonia sp. (in: high G+C Gram-positive bacteria)]
MRKAFDLPAHPEPLSRHPKAPASGAHIDFHHSVCFGCGEDAPVGLRIKVIAGDEFDATATMAVEQWMQGGPGVIHGGLLSAAFDEVMGTNLLLIGKPAVTVHLEIEYAKPIPLGATLHFESEVICKERRKVYTRAVAHLGDPAEPAVAAAHAIFVTIDVAEHYAEYSDAVRQSLH